MLSRLFKSNRQQPEQVIRSAHRPGHFYSPVVDPDLLKHRERQLWRQRLEVSGVSFNDASHRWVLSELFPKYLPLFDYPQERSKSEPDRFYVQNPSFGWLDPRALFVLLNHWRPGRMIEVGSGFSSLLTADINSRFFDNALEFYCVEPFPKPFLLGDIPGISEVVTQKVEDLPVAFFKLLQAGDVLFIDSSHVAKTGSDVNHLLFEVLPVLNEGVYIHFHDIFLPREYPKKWVLEENRSWNEQYLIQALLMHSDTFEVVFGCNYAHLVFPELLEAAMGVGSGMSFGGGSLWIRKKIR